MMRRHVLPGLGDLGALALETVPMPEPGRGTVRVRVAATALGYVDALIARGRYQVKPELPFVPGGEIAGEIDAIGDGVTGFAVGNRVAAWLFAGGLADHAIVPAAALVRIPDALDAACAAAMLVDYLTAHYALFGRGRLRQGETVLVLGAAGGVGSAAVALAAQGGAHVIASASSAAKQAHARSMSAHSCIGSDGDDWRDRLRASLAGAGLDVVVDPVGGAATELAFRSLAKDGRHLVIGFASGEIARLPANLVLLKSASLIGVDVRHLVTMDLEAAGRIWDVLFAAAAAGDLRRPLVDGWAFEAAGDALRRVEARDRIGKIVVHNGSGMA